MDLRTDPIYRQAVRTYQFLMNTSNSLLPEGVLKPFRVDHHSVGKGLVVAFSSPFLPHCACGFFMTDFIWPHCYFYMSLSSLFLLQPLCLLISSLTAPQILFAHCSAFPFIRAPFMTQWSYFDDSLTCTGKYLFLKESLTSRSYGTVRTCYDDDRDVWQFYIFAFFMLFN